MNVRLRRAVDSDRALLRSWRNDPETVRNSLVARRVGAAEHARWFAAKQADPRARLFVILSGRRPAGQVRLDLGPRREAEVSIAVAPEMRGRGIATHALRAAAAPARRLGAEKLVARVKPGNLASVMAFLKAGFRFARHLRGADPAYLMDRTL